MSQFWHSAMHYLSSKDMAGFITVICFCDYIGPCSCLLHQTECTVLITTWHIVAVIHKVIRAPHYQTVVMTIDQKYLTEY